jgi:hypothetical protein
MRGVADPVVAPVRIGTTQRQVHAGAGAKVEQVHRVAGYPPVAFCSDPFGHGFCIVGLWKLEQDPR